MAPEPARPPNATAALLARFRLRHPSGAVRTTLVGAAPHCAVQAAVYRHAMDRQPATTALVTWELDAPLQRTRDRDDALRAAERRAMRRALRRLETQLPPCTASTNGVARSYVLRSDDPYAAPPSSAPPRRAAIDGPSDTVTAVLRDRLADLDVLIAAAERAGVRARRAQTWRTRLRALRDAEPSTLARLDRAERRLRRWIAKREP